MNSSYPLVSVIIPCHNRVALLARAVASVSKQTYPNIEIIVVDDASTEDLRGPIAAINDSVIFIRNDISLRAQKSRLKGVEAARGEYVAMLDSDDWWQPEKISRQFALYEKHAPALISSRIRMHTSSGFEKIMPAKLLRSGQRVEEYWFCEDGQLQTSTLFSEKAILLDLLRETAHTTVHNDPAVTLAAQRRGIPCIQVDEVLTECDGTERSDRISSDKANVTAAAQWFKAECGDWSARAKRGYLFNARVERYLSCGMYGAAFTTAVANYNVEFGWKKPLKYLLLIASRGRAKLVGRTLSGALKRR